MSLCVSESGYSSCIKLLLASIENFKFIIIKFFPRGIHLAECDQCPGIERDQNMTEAGGVSVA